jgi:hypothetical protein
LDNARYDPNMSAVIDDDRTTIDLTNSKSARLEVDASASSSRWRTWPLSLFVILIPAVVFGIRIAASLHRPFTSGGDLGIAEISVNQTLHGIVSLGPYSRYGWHHLGPAYFYEFAPFYALSGESSRALFLGAWVLNMGCAVAAVWLIRRVVSEAVARIAAVVLLGYFAALISQSLIDPWNPSLLRLPLFLILVASALACTGSAGSLVVAYIAGSYAMQTHIGTAPVTLAILLIATAAFVWRRRTLTRTPAQQQSTQQPEGSRTSSRSVLATGALVLVLMWAGPVVQQFTASKGNISQIAQFYSNPPAADGPIGHTLHKSAVAIADYSTVVPFGSVPNTDTGEAPVNDNHRKREVIIGFVGLLGIAIGLAGWRRNSGLAAMGLFGSVSLLIAVYSASRVIGPLYGYLFWWTSLISAVIVIATLGLAFQAAGRWSERRGGALSGARLQQAGVAAGIAVMVVATGLFTNYVRKADVISYADSPPSIALAKQIEQYVGYNKKATFNFDINTFAGFEDDTVVTQLEKDGYTFHMNKPLDLYKGTAKTASVTGPTFHFGIPAQPPSELPGKPFALTEMIRATVTNGETS